MILAAYVVSSSGLIGILIQFLILLLILGLIYYIITLLPLPPIVLRIAQIILALVVIIYLASFLTGCATVKPQFTINRLTPEQKVVAAEVSAEAANAVVSLGLSKASDYTKNLNPYVHSAMAGIYANQGTIFTAADVAKITKDYGDPAQPEKFKQLGRNLWAIAKREAGPIALNAALKYVGFGAQTGQTPKEAK